MSEVLLLILSYFILLLVGNLECVPCVETESVDLSGGQEYANGTIVQDNVVYDNGTWYEKVVDGVLMRYGCPCVRRKCLRKCCEKGSAYFGSTCNSSQEMSFFRPQLYKGVTPVHTRADQHFFFLYGLSCEDKYLLDPSGKDTHMFIQEVSKEDIFNYLY